MNTLSKLVSAIAFVAVTLPCLLFFFAVLELDTVKWITLVGTIAWFIATPFWMGRELTVDAKEVEI